MMAHVGRSGMRDAAMLLLVLLLAGAMGACSQDEMFECDGTPFKQVQSPDARHVAQARRRRLGWKMMLRPGQQPVLRGKRSFVRTLQALSASGSCRERLSRD